MTTPKRDSAEKIVTWWECVCGKRAMPLTDDTKCGCKDIYEQAWYHLPEGSTQLLTERRRLLDEHGIKYPLRRYLASQRAKRGKRK